MLSAVPRSRPIVGVGIKVMIRKIRVSGRGHSDDSREVGRVKGLVTDIPGSCTTVLLFVYWTMFDSCSWWQQNLEHVLTNLHREKWWAVLAAGV